MQPRLKALEEPAQAAKAAKPGGIHSATLPVLGYVMEASNHGDGCFIKPVSGSQYVNNVMNIQNGGYHLACCGAAGITSLSWKWNNERDVQGFVCCLARSLNFNMTYYFIASTSQLTMALASKYGNNASVLKKLGAVEVDASPNRNHGPNRMHLHVWNPNRDHPGWKEFLDLGRYETNPLWFAKLSREEQVAEIAKGEDILKAYDDLQLLLKANNAKVRLDQRTWDAYYLTRDGKMVDRLAYYGLKVVDKNGNDYPAKRPDVPEAVPVGLAKGEKW